MVALNKTYQKTLTPDRSAKDSGHRFYSPEISRWLNRDPIGEQVNDAAQKVPVLLPPRKTREFYLQPADIRRGHSDALVSKGIAGYVRFSVNLHAFVENAPVGVIDAFGLAVAALEPEGHGTFLGLPLVTVEGPMQTPPGGAGVVAPGPINENQNCGSVTLSVDKPVQWPHTAEMPGDFAKAKAFIPKGCREVSPEGISTHASRCACGQYDREAVVFLWKLPPYGNDAVVVYHALGRGTALPQSWTSKKGQFGKTYVNISDPVANADLLDPSGTFAGTERVMRVFCCIQAEMQWKNLNL